MLKKSDKNTKIINGEKGGRKKRATGRLTINEDKKVWRIVEKRYWPIGKKIISLQSLFLRLEKQLITKLITCKNKELWHLKEL